MTGLPQNPSGTGLFSFCWRSGAQLPPGGVAEILHIGGPGTNSFLEIALTNAQNPQAGNAYQNNIQIRINGPETNPSTLFAQFWQQDAFDGNYHGGIFSWDAANQWADSWIDGSPTTAAITAYGTPTYAVAYNGGPAYVGGVCTSQGTPPVLVGYNGDLAELVLFAGGAVVDPTNSDVVNAFFDLSVGLPTRKAASGMLTAQGPLANLQANLILSGGVDMFGMNLPQQVPSLDAWSDPAPQGAFVSVGSAPTTSTEDPWGFS